MNDETIEKDCKFLESDRECFIYQWGYEQGKKEQLEKCLEQIDILKEKWLMMEYSDLPDIDSELRINDIIDWLKQSLTSQNQTKAA